MAMVGASLLNFFASAQPLAQYVVFGRICTISPEKLIIAALIIVFAIMELSPSSEKLTSDAKFIPIGGALSGFFGGIFRTSGGAADRFSKPGRP